jgi:hypothetical protein
MKISEKTAAFVKAQDEKLNAVVGYVSNPLAGWLKVIELKGSVEVGWRECCGCRDNTAKERAAWVKLVARLVADGNEFAIERIKHGNGYATMKGGFWQSERFTLRVPSPGI